MAQTYNVQIEDSEGNKYCPKPDLLTTKEQLAANNASGKSVDALVVKEINNNLTKVKTYVGTDGKLHSVDGTGADTVLNFSSGIKKVQAVRSKTITADSDYIGIIAVTANGTPGDIKINGVVKSSETTGAAAVHYVLHDGKAGDKIDLTSSANYIYLCLLAK